MSNFNSNFVFLPNFLLTSKSCNKTVPLNKTCVFFLVFHPLTRNLQHALMMEQYEYLIS